MAVNYSSLVKIHTLNINGLEKKLKKLTDFICQNKIDILLLQETHNIDKKTVEKHFQKYGQRAYLNKEKNQHNNYNGTAFIVNENTINNFRIESSVLQTNRLQKLTLQNDANEIIVLFNTLKR